MKRKYTNMLNGPLFSGIISYTVPIILTSILQLLFNAADLVVVGRYCGSISVGAVGATSSLTNLLVNFFVGISIGAGVVVAHAIGRRDDAAVHRAVHTAMPVAIVCGVVISLIGITFAEPLLRLMGTPENVLPLSAMYMRICFSGAVFQLVLNFYAAILRAAGDTKTPMVSLTIAGVINVALNIVFVTQLHMNVAGVALATIISHAVSSILVVLAVMRRKDACKLQLKQIRFHKAPFVKMLRIGVPAGIQSSLFSISNVLIQSSINSFGDVFMSGNAAAGNIEGFIYVAMNAFHQTAVNYTGQNAGAMQYKRVYKTFGICLICAAVIGFALGQIVCAFGPQLLSIYITDSQLAIEYGMVRFAYVAATYFLCGLMDVATGVLRGIGASSIPMLISILGICGLRVVWIYTVFQIPQFHTPQCLYMSYIVTWVVTFIGETIAFLILCKKRMRVDKSAISG